MNINKLLPSMLVIALFLIIVSSSIEINRSLYAIEKLNATKATGAYKAGSPGVKILYPVQGAKIAVGKNLTLTGISTYNAPTGCLVSVIVNNIKPYMQALATGQKGKNDYSTWKYTIDANHGLIKEGVNSNKATAKLSCHDNTANITKYYSVNLTGTSTDLTNKSSRLHQNASSGVPNTNNTNDRTQSISTITKDQAAHPEKALLPASSGIATSQHSQSTNTQKLLDNSSMISTAAKSTSVGSSKPKVSTIAPEKPLADKNNEPFVLTLPSSNSSSPLPPSSPSSTQPAVQDSSNHNLHSHNQRGN